jgi:phospholipid transport system substrate-binding protein
MTVQPSPIQVSRSRARQHRTRRPATSWLAVAAAAVMLGSACVALAQASDPMASVKDTVNAVLVIVQDPSYKSAPSQRREKLRETIAPHFDFSDMARSAMGYHWRTLSSAQRDEFARLFTSLLEASYMGKIEGYKGQKIEYVRETQDGPNAVVYTNIVQSGNEPVSVNYRLKQADGTWKVYDVAVDQISLVGNYRNQFNRIMNDKGYDRLIQAIHQKVVALDSNQ